MYASRCRLPKQNPLYLQLDKFTLLWAPIARTDRRRHHAEPAFIGFGGPPTPPNRPGPGVQPKGSGTRSPAHSEQFTDRRNIGQPWFLRGEVRGGGSPPGMSRETPRGKRKSQGRSRHCGIAQPSPEPGRHTDLREYCSIALTWAACGLGAREPPRDEPRSPKRKKEKPRDVKIL